MTKLRRTHTRQIIQAEKQSTGLIINQFHSFHWAIVLFVKYAFTEYMRRFKKDLLRFLGSKRVPSLTPRVSPFIVGAEAGKPIRAIRGCFVEGLENGTISDSIWLRVHWINVTAHVLLEESLLHWFYNFIKITRPFLLTNSWNCELYFGHWGVSIYLVLNNFLLCLSCI